MSLLAKFREFLSKQSKNYKVLLVRGIGAQSFQQLVMNFNSLYIVELGASAFQLSSVRAVGSVVSAAISLPVGWLSDIYSIKKIMTLGMIIQILSVAFYAFALDWRWIIAAVVCATLTMTLVFRIENIILANSLADHNRARGYGTRETIMRVFSVFAPTIGGLIVHLFGGISVEGIRPLYYIQLVGFSAVSLFVIWKLDDIDVDRNERRNNFLEEYREMFNSGKNLKMFAILQSMGSITWGLSMPFPFVYAADFKGADAILVGYMGTSFGLIAMLLAIPMGIWADKRGRKFTIFLTRPFFYASYILLILAPPEASWVLLLAWSCRGVMMSSRSWMTMSMEMVPQKFRGRWTGFLSLLSNAIRVPAMLLGGYLYESGNPELVFIIPVLVDLFVRMPMLTRIPETMKKEN
ncbi:MAG: MFS transporter [Candidatus Bathyarchaeia archaeon]